MPGAAEEHRAGRGGCPRGGFRPILGAEFRAHTALQGALQSCGTISRRTPGAGCLGSGSEPPAGTPSPADHRVPWLCPPSRRCSPVTPWWPARPPSNCPGRHLGAPPSALGSRQTATLPGSPCTARALASVSRRRTWSHPSHPATPSLLLRCPRAWGVGRRGQSACNPSTGAHERKGTHLRWRQNCVSASPD